MRRSNLRVSKSPKGVLQGSTGLEAHNRRLDPMTKVTIGVDLGDQYSQLYVVDAAGTCVETGRVRTTRAGLERWVRRASAGAGGARSGHAFAVGQPGAAGAGARGAGGES